MPSTIKERDENIPSKPEKLRGCEKGANQSKDERALGENLANSAERKTEAQINTSKIQQEASGIIQTDLAEAMNENKNKEQNSESKTPLEELLEGKNTSAPGDEATNENSKENADLKNKSDEELSQMLLESQEENGLEENRNSESSETAVKTEESDDSPAPQDDLKVTVGQDEEKLDEEEKSEEVSPKTGELIAALELEEQPVNNEEQNLYNLDCPESPVEKKKTSPRNMMQLSISILSYERFYPGRILGNTFVARNNSSQPVKFTISFSNTGMSPSYVGEKLCEYYTCDSISEIEDSYTKHLNKHISDAEEDLSPWYVEDPYTKRLTKETEFELAPHSEEEFIVVLKSPSENKQKLYAANVVLSQQNGFQNSVFCFGCMESLKISIPKEMYNTKLKARMVKIVMRKRQPAQAIKLLLENKGDMHLVSNFQSVEMEDNLQFYLTRDRISFEPNSKALLEIRALHKLGGLGDDDEPQVIHKLIVAKVKDCELKFSIMFEITII